MRVKVLPCQSLCRRNIKLLATVYKSRLNLTPLLQKVLNPVLSLDSYLDIDLLAVSAKYKREPSDINFDPTIII